MSVIYGGDGGCFSDGGGGRREYHPHVALVWVIINDENWTFIERRVWLSEICVYMSVCMCAREAIKNYIHIHASRKNTNPEDTENQ